MMVKLYDLKGYKIAPDVLKDALDALRMLPPVERRALREAALRAGHCTKVQHPKVSDLGLAIKCTGRVPQDVVAVLTECVTEAGDLTEFGNSYQLPHFVSSIRMS